jgi:preprotein translocase subunit SecA
MVTAQSAFVRPFAALYQSRLNRSVQRVSASADRLDGVSDEALRREIFEVRQALRRDQASHSMPVARAFALIRESSARVLGMRHFDAQLIGGLVMLDGKIAEMDTGEGKTLTASLAAATAALGGTPVHVVTVNDYLAGRDADILRPLYEFLGLSVGVVRDGMSNDEKIAAYGCDITYTTNKILAFDYLRDRLALGRRRGNLRHKFGRLRDGQSTMQPLLSGLHFVIVDEADSILVDEARTPLLLSRNMPPTLTEEVLHQALALAHALHRGSDYRLHENERRIELTQAGKTRVKEITQPHGGLWTIAIQREEWAQQALTAVHLFHPDEQYLVSDGKVQIVDEYTGRVMADRFWSDGLHQMIEAKEGCAISGTRGTIARMTYQRFFRRYRRLAGMSGTATEIARELWQVYRLAVVRIPQHRQSQRIRLPDRVVATESEKWRAITETVAAISNRGAPVLVGTRSVAASQKASEFLHAAGLDHRVLNAAQDAAEAAIVAAAGQEGRITVATNMAGRGTDIRLASGVSERGGLHVIISERHDARRIDRQLAGRCARQGQPGSYQAILSMDDGILDMDASGLMRMLGRFGLWLEFDWAARASLRGAQWRAERLHSRMRRELLRIDEVLDDALAFAGQPE